MKTISKVVLSTVAAVGLLASPAKADEPNLGAYANPFGYFIATGTSVSVEFLYSLAANTSYLLLWSPDFSTPTALVMTIPGSYPAVGSGTPLSTTINTFAGQQLYFGICTSTAQGDEDACARLSNALSTDYSGFFMGAGSNNVDSQVHAALLTGSQWNPLCTAAAACNASGYTTQLPWVLGFEDQAINSDWDFNDVVFALDGVTPVPEPATMGLMALGLVGLSGAGFIRRRKRDQA